MNDSSIHSAVSGMHRSDTARHRLRHCSAVSSWSRNSGFRRRVRGTRRAGPVQARTRAARNPAGVPDCQTWSGRDFDVGLGGVGLRDDQTAVYTSFQVCRGSVTPVKSQKTISVRSVHGYMEQKRPCAYAERRAIVWELPCWYAYVQDVRRLWED